MELTGRLIFKTEVQKISEKFCKVDFVIETEEQYPQKIKFELHQDRVDIIDSYKIGDLITVSFNLKGRDFLDKEGKTQYSNTLQAWKIQR